VRARLALLALLLAACGKGGDAPAAEGGAGEVHLVRMVAQGDRYAFDPAEVRVRPGDRVRFVLVGNQPESIVFDTAGTPAGVAAFLRERDLLRGVLLTRPGQEYEASFGDAPPGRYPFFSIPHAPHGMRGAVVVEAPPPP